MALRGTSGRLRSTITPARSPNAPAVRLAAIITRLIFAPRLNTENNGKTYIKINNVEMKYNLGEF